MASALLRRMQVRAPRCSVDAFAPTSAEAAAAAVAVQRIHRYAAGPAGQQAARAQGVTVAARGPCTATCVRLGLRQSVLRSRSSVGAAESPVEEVHKGHCPRPRDPTCSRPEGRGAERRQNRAAATKPQAPWYASVAAG